MGSGAKYRIDFDAQSYLAGAGRDFIPANAALDGDWVCEHLDIPFDRYYQSYDVQQEGTSFVTSSRSVVPLPVWTSPL